VVESLIEFLLQFVIEILFELGIRGVWNRRERKKPAHFILAGIYYAALAAIAGFVTVIFFPEHFIKDTNLRLANFMVAPLFVGFMMGMRGKILRKKGKVAIRLDTFSYGFLFAFIFAAFRFWFCK
jgi:hypothetical protein